MILNGRIITGLFAKNKKGKGVVVKLCYFGGTLGEICFESFTTMGGLSQKCVVIVIDGTLWKQNMLLYSQALYMFTKRALIFRRPYVPKEQKKTHGNPKHFHDAFASRRFEHLQKTSVKLVSGQKSASQILEKSRVVWNLAY